MDRIKIPKSELLKNVPIETINSYRDRIIVNNLSAPVRVLESNNQYYVESGLEEVLCSHYNSDGDDLIECIVRHNSDIFM